MMMIIILLDDCCYCYDNSVNAMVYSFSWSWSGFQFSCFQSLRTHSKALRAWQRHQKLANNALTRLPCQNKTRRKIFAAKNICSKKTIRATQYQSIRFVAQFVCVLNLKRNPENSPAVWRRRAQNLLQAQISL